MKTTFTTYPAKWGLLLWLFGTVLTPPATAQLFYAEQIYQEGIVLYEQGRFEDAYRKFQEYEQQGVPDKKFYVYFAVSAARSGHEDAADILRRGLQRFPGDADLTLLLIQFLAEQHRFLEAMEYLEKARPHIVPEEYRKFMGGLAFNQGVLLYQEGKKKASIPYFRKAVEYQPEEPRFVRNLAVVLWETGNQKEAIAVLEKGVRRFPNDKEMNRMLIAFYEKTQNLTALREKLEQWAQRSGELADYLVLGQFYLYTGAEQQARKLFQMLEKKFPRAREVYTVQVRFYQGLMQFQRADSVLTRMEKMLPADTLTCRLKAENFEKMEKLSEAARYWQKCTQLSPKKENFHFRLLRTLEKTDSTAYFRHLMVMDSLFQKPEVRLKIALEWYRHGRYDRARVILEGVREQLPKNPVVLTYLGLCLQHVGSDSTAMDLFRQALQIGSAPPEAYFALAHGMFQQGKQKECDFYFFLGMELLLQRLQQSQTATTSQLKKENLGGNSLTVENVVEAYLDDETFLKEQIQWYLKVHSDRESQELLEQLLQRYPRNVYLRLVLADMAMEAHNWAEAEKYLNDVLYLQPRNLQAVRRKLLLAKLQLNNREAYRLYLNLLYRDASSFTETDFRELIRLAQLTGQMDNLAQQLVVLYRRKSNVPLLKKFAVEVLELTGKKDLARKIQESSPSAGMSGLQQFVPIVVQ